MKASHRDAVLLKMAAQLLEGDGWATITQLTDDRRQRERIHDIVRELYDDAKVDRRNAYRGRAYEYRINDRGFAILRAAREGRLGRQRVSIDRRREKKEALGLVGAPSPSKASGPSKIRVRDLPKTNAPPARNFAEAMTLARQAALERRTEGAS